MKACRQTNLRNLRDGQIVEIDDRLWLRFVDYNVRTSRFVDQ